MTDPADPQTKDKRRLWGMKTCPAAPAERQLSVQLRDLRRDARQRARRADPRPSRPSRPRRGRRKFDPNRSFTPREDSALCKPQQTLGQSPGAAQ